MLTLPNLKMFLHVLPSDIQESLPLLGTRSSRKGYGSHDLQNNKCGEWLPSVFLGTLVNFKSRSCTFTELAM